MLRILNVASGMTVEMWFLCSVIVVAVVLFVTEKVSIDVTSIFIAFILMASGLVDIRQGLSGFSNQAALAILALLILNTGLERTGVLRLLTGRLVSMTGKGTVGILILLLPFVAVLSAFTNNTAVIAIFLPVLLMLGDKKGISPSKLLMPMAFISILGGLCTIIGTSTNLLVNSIARQYQIAPFTFFEFADIGLAMVVVGIVYTLLIGHRAIPSRRRPVQQGTGAELKQYLTEVMVSDGSTLTGSLADVGERLNAMDIELIRVNTERGQAPGDVAHVFEGDRLLLKASSHRIAALKREHLITLVDPDHRSLLARKKQEMHLVEAVVAPGSELLDRRLKEVDLMSRYEAIPLALHRSGKVDRKDLANSRLRLGDVLLLEATDRLASDPDVTKDLILLNTIPMVQNMKRRLVAIFIFAGAIAAAAFDLVPIVISALGGVLLMAVTRCINMNEAYKRVEWKVYFLIAGLIPLGIAIQNTGLDDKIASGFLGITSGLNGFTVIVVLYTFTVVVTNLMANNATALLMAPIAVKIAIQMGIDPKALLLTVIFGASTSFFTPVGYHTLTLVYTPGRYRFRDYFLAGFPLTILVGGVACWMIWQRYLPN